MITFDAEDFVLAQPTISAHTTKYVRVTRAFLVVSFGCIGTCSKWNRYGMAGAVHGINKRK